MSCQPVVDGPMDDPEIVARQAQAARDGGAAGLRLEVVETVRTVAQSCNLPTIGIMKRDLPNSPVRITPWLEDVDALIEAGAAIVAYDATLRERPVAAAKIAQRIRDGGAIAMADCATRADGRRALEEGADILGTTLSGYAYEEAAETAGPDLPLVAEFSAMDAYVIAEGRYHMPTDAAAAIDNGADAVVVGSAITRIEHITGWYATAIHGAHKKANLVRRPVTL